MNFFDTKSVNDRLLQLSTKTGYNCIQKNGQRTYGPPPNWTGPPPVRGSEIFIGKLPRDCFEDEIVPFLQSVGPIYELRLMMNFTGFNRGFAFATYFNPRDAWKAVKKLNNCEIKSGYRVGISKSIDNCRLYVGGIPVDKNKIDVWEEVIKICPTAEDIIFYPNTIDCNRNRGFFFIQFDCHRSAAMARRAFYPGTVRMWNCDVNIDWADPEPDIDPDIMDKITKLFIRNIHPGLNSDYFRLLLEDTVPLTAITRIYLAGHYAFLHFDSRYHAEQAKDKLSHIVRNGEFLEVQWARPKCFKKQVSMHCKSVPPRFKASKPKPDESPVVLPSKSADMPELETPSKSKEKHVAINTNNNTVHYYPCACHQRLYIPAPFGYYTS